ncbi:MAG: complement resistance protein TraT [Pseudomonadota bacterium]
MKILNKIILLFSILTLTSCAAISTAVSKRNLEVKTKMQSSIFLNPVTDNLKTVFIQTHNTSDQQSFNVVENLRRELRKKDYRVTNDPGQSHYILQINILQAGKTSKTALEKSPFGVLDAVGFGAAGAMIGGRNGKIGGTIIGGVIGAGASVVANSLVEDVYYSAITDIRIIEKQKGDNIIYQTRILSSANKVNLKWEVAQPELEKGLANSIAGVF